MRQPWSRIATPLVCGLALALAGGPTTGLGGAAAAATLTAPQQSLADVDQSIAGFEASLRATTRADDPDHWAALKTRLGVALAVRGELIPGPSGVESLQQAIAAFQDALTVFTPDKDEPQEEGNWQIMLKNLATAQASLGARLEGQGGLDALKASAATYRTALERYTFESFAGDWATIHVNLSGVYNLIADRSAGPESSAARTEAAAAARNALRIYSRDSIPADWAAVQANLGAALRGLAETAEPKADLLQQSIAAYTQALRVRTRKAMPAEWAETSLGLAEAEAALAEARHDPKLMRTAIGRIDETAKGLPAADKARWEARLKQEREAMAAALPRLQQPKPTA